MLKRLLITFLFLSLTSIAHAADTKEIWITPEASDYSRLATGLAGSNITIISSDEIVKSAEKNGIADFMKILRIMPSVDIVEFGVEDIVRSGLVKEYLP